MMFHDKRIKVGDQLLLEGRKDFFKLTAINSDTADLIFVSGYWISGPSKDEPISGSIGLGRIKEVKRTCEQEELFA